MGVRAYRIQGDLKPKRRIQEQGYLNKTQRRVAAVDKLTKANNQAMDIAMKALERIESHEKECGERWSETIVEIKHLQDLTSSHSARWEKLAWLVVAAVVVQVLAGMF